MRVTTTTTRTGNLKNGDNGRKIIYARNTDLPDLCPVLAALRIALRAIPGSTFLRNSKTKRPIFITDGLVTQLIRTAAKAVYHLLEGDPKLRKGQHTPSVSLLQLFSTGNASCTRTFRRDYVGKAHNS